jgi:hypothetical protein
VNGAVPAGANNNEYRPFSLARKRVKETITFILNYNLRTEGPGVFAGHCTLELWQPGRRIPSFRGECADHPNNLTGRGYPLATVEDPRRRLELLPIIVMEQEPTDDGLGIVGGFGSINGYLVYPPGGLSRGDGTAPIGFSGHFLYTSTYVPPSPVYWGSQWFIGRSNGQTRPCIYSGTIRVGNVPTY